MSINCPFVKTDGLFLPNRTSHPIEGNTTLHSRHLANSTTSTTSLNNYANAKILFQPRWFKILLPCITCLVSYLIDENGFVTKLIFSNSIVVSLGKISYGIYLYHFIVYSLLDKHISPSMYEILHEMKLINPMKILITIIIAYLSWNLIERPILKLKRHFKYN